jgi:uncharacterized cupin superfamily protein
MSHQLQRLAPNSNGGETSPVDPSKLLAGSPMQTCANMFTNKKENFFCGVWSSQAGKWKISYTEDEFCYLISGQAIVTDSDGVENTLLAGDAFVIPAGFEGSWETIGEAAKFYAVYEEPEA